MAPPNSNSSDKNDRFYLLDPESTDPRRIKQEREKARKLRKTNWWTALVNRGECHYCGRKFPPAKLTMDHIVPLARGGASTKGNIVPACPECNRSKKLDTPADQILSEMNRRRSEESGGSNGDDES